jgi:hypothetical protein
MSCGSATGPARSISAQLLEPCSAEVTVKDKGAADTQGPHLSPVDYTVDGRRIVIVDSHHMSQQVSREGQEWLNELTYWTCSHDLSCEQVHDV